MTIISAELKHLLLLGHESRGEFIISVNQQALSCERIVRLIPGKRIVATADWNQQRVIAKIFLSARAKKHVERELKGHAALTKLGLPVPRIVYHGQSDVHGVSVILYQYLPIDRQVDDIWQGNDDEQLKKLLENMQNVLAKQHENNIVQSDLHPQNFLLSNHVLYCIDYSTLLLNKTLSQTKEMMVLAGLYAQLYVRHHRLIEESFKHYCKRRGWKFDEVLLEQLNQAVLHQASKRIAKLKSKILRNSSAVKFVRRAFYTFAYLRGCYQHYVLDFFEMPYEYLRSTVASPLKLGRSSSVYHILFPGHNLVVKRYNVSSIWKWFRRCFRASKARKTWVNAHMLQLLGIPSGAPVAFIDYHFLGLQGSSYVILEHVGGRLLADYLAGLKTEKEEDDFVEKVEQIFELMVIARVCHRDCKASNFIMTRDGQLHLIDIDNLKIYTDLKKFKQHFGKEVDRFLRNWEKGSSLRQKMERKLERFKAHV